MVKRAFPDGGFYPFPAGALLAALLFCAFSAALVWRVAPARVLRPFFVLYALACVAAFLVPSPLGANVTRLRFAAVPIALLLFALRDWRPRKVVVAGVALAGVWNIQPVIANVQGSTADASTRAAYWAPAVRYLKQHLSPSYRVEVVDTVGHWGATYLPRAGIPLTRGWFRQYDFPQNEVLYGSLGRSPTGSGSAASASATSCKRTRRPTTAPSPRRRLSAAAGQASSRSFARRC